MKCMDFDQISYNLSIHCKAASDISGHRMLYKDPEVILTMLKRIGPQIIEHKGKRVYLFENETRPEVFALIDSQSGLPENEIYDAVFREKDSTIGVYVREVIGLDETIPNLLYLLTNTNKRLNA